MSSSLSGGAVTARLDGGNASGHHRRRPTTTSTAATAASASTSTSMTSVRPQSLALTPRCLAKLPSAPCRRPLLPFHPRPPTATSGDGGFPAPSSRSGDEGPLNKARPASASTSPSLSARCSSSSSPLPSSSSSAPSLSPARRLPASRLARFLLTLPLEISAAGARTNDHYLARRKKKGWWSHRFPVVPGRSSGSGGGGGVGSGVGRSGSSPAQQEQPEEPAAEPVSASAWAKAIPLGAIFFCASFNLTILQNLKDALIVTAGGAETLPFLASVGVLPASLGFFVFYRALVDRAKRRDAADLAAAAGAGGGGGEAAAAPPSATAGNSGSGHRSVFFLALLPLVAFYAFFAAVLYPSSAWLHPHGFYAALEPVVPAGLHGLLKVVEHWTFSLFFCVAELWGAVAISVLFWGLANEVCSVADARAIYPLMGVAANVALVVAGNYVKMMNAAVGSGGGGASATAAASAAGATAAASAAAGAASSSSSTAAATAAAAAATDAAAPALRILVRTVVTLSAAMCVAKAWVNARVPRPPPDPKKVAKAKAEAAKAAAEAAQAANGVTAVLASSSSADETAKKSERRKKKKKKSLGDSLAALRAYPMISNLALLVVGYGVSHRLFEFAWKGALRQLHPSSLAYQAALADVSIATGYVTIFLMLAGRFVFQFLGWRVAAAATPAVMLAAGGAFFGLSLAGAGALGPGAADAALAAVSAATGGRVASAAAAGVAAGAVTQVFARASKLSLFDPAKEMVYIEMDPDEKAAGKAAVDLVGSQVGKSGASWVTQALLLAFGSLQAGLGVIVGVYGVVIIAWLRAVGGLGRMMEAHDRADAAREAAEEEAAKAAAQAAAEAAEAASAAGTTTLTSSPIANGDSASVPPPASTVTVGLRQRGASTAA